LKAILTNCRQEETQHDSALREKTISDAVELLKVNGFDGLADAVTVLLNSAMVAERSDYLGVASYERSVNYVPTMGMRSPVAADIRAIFNAPDRNEADRLLAKFLDGDQKTAPKLADWAEEALPEGFTVFALPPSHRRRLRTTNLVERLNEEIRQRTRVARLFPNEASCLRPVSVILMEIAEDWQTAHKRYLTFSD